MENSTQLKIAYWDNGNNADLESAEIMRDFFDYPEFKTAEIPAELNSNDEKAIKAYLIEQCLISIPENN